MHQKVKFGFLALACAGIGALSYWAGTPPALAETGGFSDGQVKSIEKIIHDYLLANPEGMLEVQDAYEKKVGAERVQAAAARLPSFYKPLASLTPELKALSIGNGDVTVVE